MTEQNKSVAAPTQMLGSQLASKPIVSSTKSPTTTNNNNNNQLNNANNKQHTHSRSSSTASINSSKQPSGSDKSVSHLPKPEANKKISTTHGSGTDRKTLSDSKNQENNSSPSNAISQTNKPPTIVGQKKTSARNGVGSAKLKSVLCKTQEAQSENLEHHALEANCKEQHVNQQQVSIGGLGSLGAKDLELLAKEAQDLKTRTRKLQLEVEEKNEIINVLKDELETLREQSDKFQRENIQLIKDAKRVKFLQDENDFLQDKVGSVEKLELEIKRLKEKLNESEFFKLRIQELEEDLTKSQDESTRFETHWREAEGKLTRVAELEAELAKWKSFSNELEQEKNSIQQKLLESIDHETRLNSINEKVEDEVKRLRDLVKSYEEERDEEQASNSLIMSVADLRQYDQQKNNTSIDIGTDPMETSAIQEAGQQTDISDTAEKSVGTEAPYPTPGEKPDETHRNQLGEENKTLREALDKQEAKLKKLTDDNERIRGELDSNRKMISGLRQDLACETSLAQKLTSQLANFTKQIKSLDKQYFPIHDTSSKTDTAIDKSHGDTNMTNLNETNLRPVNSVSSELREKCKHESIEVKKDSSCNRSGSPSKGAIELQEYAESASKKNDNGKSSDNQASRELYLKENSVRLPPSSKLEIGTWNSVRTSNNEPPASKKSALADALKTWKAASHATVGSNGSCLPSEDVVVVAGKQIDSAQSNRSTPSAAIFTNSKTLGDSDSKNQTFSTLTMPTQSETREPSGCCTSNSVDSSCVNANSIHASVISSSLSIKPDGAPNMPETGVKQSILTAGSPTTSLGANSNRCAEANACDSQQSIANHALYKSTQMEELDQVASARKTNMNNDPSDDENHLDNDQVNGLNAKKLNGLACTSYANKSNFVRNSLPSRSVNFGHSKSSAYLDRIRASVKTTTTTNSMVSFNESTTKNVLVTSQQQPQRASDSRFVLNCMLDHQHLERCFAPVGTVRPGLVQVSQPMLDQENIYNHNYAQNQGQSNTSPSRQLNALIDPTTHEQLLRGMYQHADIAQLHTPDQRLTEQQIAHLNNLHRQHYYHHLHQLHQMHHQHHLHHMHHLHHKCLQQQQYQHQQHQKYNSNTTTSQSQTNREPVNPSFTGSQFYASGGRYDQIYSNTSTKDVDQPKQQNGTKLVIKNEQHRQSHMQQPPLLRQEPTRASPHRGATNPIYQNVGKNLPQIDEMNGLPTVIDQMTADSMPRRVSPTSGDQRYANLNGNGVNSRSSQSKNKSPTSSASPTSSRTSSNVSPSSESSTSSSSSVNSSSTSGMPLTRSALRHTTNSTRRQFSVERELASSIPLTATLSRVGSCRGTPANIQGVDASLVNHSNDINQMRSPVKSHQPSMKTSKILNIGQQACSGQAAVVKTSCNADDSNDITSNLANIKLNDNLAFSSLRVPRKSLSGANLNSSFVLGAKGVNLKQTGYENGKSTSSSSSPDKMRMNASCSGHQAHTDNNNTNSGSKSSIWFEYGCI